jgi:PKD repeat protein
VLAFLAAVFLALFSPAAIAAPATNDDFDNATPIAALPFTDSVDTRAATAAADDPTTCTNNGSVWYRFTPGTDMVIGADTAGSDYYTALSAYTGSRGALAQVPDACVYGAGSRLVFSATANTTYYFLVGDCCGNGGSGGGGLVFSVAEVQPPVNDDFADATTVSALPFNNSVDSSAATRQAGEPTSACGSGESGTAWYAFTPTETASIMASVPNNGIVAAYTGSSIGSLNEVGCRGWYGHVTFRATAGQTYYFQVGRVYGQDPVQFALALAPPPVAWIALYPSDPSTYDTVQFYDYSYDPADAGIASREWQLGDGATATDYSVSHRYAAEGDYTVRLTVTTVDGRTASTSQTLHVRTHDVAIVRFSAPESASVGQTRQISVDIRNTRYPETVTVQLLKGVPGGFQSVGYLTQYVPVRASGRVTSFAFSYTFTSGDAAMGKVTFKAIATLQDARDVLPADNEAISSPTKVNPT